MDNDPGHYTTKGDVLVFSDMVPKTVLLKQKKCIVSQFWRLEI